MSKRSPLPQQRRHVSIFDEDWDFLMQEFGPHSTGRAIGVGTAIRTIVHAHVVAMKARANEKFDQIRSEMKSVGSLIIESRADQNAGSDE